MFLTNLYIIVLIRWPFCDEFNIIIGHGYFPVWLGALVRIIWYLGIFVKRKSFLIFPLVVELE